MRKFIPRFGLKTLFVAITACCLIASQLRVSKPRHTTTGPVQQEYTSRSLYFLGNIELLNIYTNYRYISDPYGWQKGIARPSFGGPRYAWCQVAPSVILQAGDDVPFIGYKSWLKRMCRDEGRAPPDWLDNWGDSNPSS